MPSTPGACNGTATTLASSNGAVDVLRLRRPHCPRPHPPHCQCPLPSLLGHCSHPPRQTCLGPPHRPSLLRAHQQPKTRVRQCRGPPLLRSSLLRLLSLSSWSPGCAVDTTTLVILCRQVEELTKLTLPVPARCIVALLGMMPPSRCCCCWSARRMMPAPQTLTAALLRGCTLSSGQ